MKSAIALACLLATLALLLTGCGGGGSTQTEPGTTEQVINTGLLEIGLAATAGFKQLPITTPASSPLALTAYYGAKITRLSQMGAGKIAFHGWDGDDEIYTINPDATRQTAITSNGVPDVEPAWSPDGKQIAFSSDRGAGRDIYLMNADGTNQRRLTVDVAHEGSPSWSPDGQKIVFTRFLENWEIFVINIDGTNPRRLTDATGNDLAPRWSPDGQKIAFHSERDGDFDIYTMDPSGLGVRRLTTNTDTDADASWSPNSERIVFRSTRSGPGKLYQMNADGSNVADTGVEGYSPCFTWDGREIVFESGDSLYIMRSNGTDRRSLDNTVMAGRPVCSPIPGRARQLLGPAGTDNGSDPPLGTSTRLVVVGLTDASGLVSAASLQVPNTAPLKVAKMAYGGYSLVGLSIAGTDLRAMLEDRGRGVLPRRWAFPTTPATGAITVLFSATTGEIRSIMTMTDQVLAASQSKSAGGLLFQGPFGAVLDARDPSRNLAAGAGQVTVDAETGLVAGTE